MDASLSGPGGAQTPRGLAQEAFAPMQADRNTHRASGHVYVVRRKRGPQFYVKYRPPQGRQVAEAARAGVAQAQQATRRLPHPGRR